MKRVGSSSELSGKSSIRFEIGRVSTRFGELPVEGFAIRTADGVVRGYANACAHRRQPVDLGDGKLFSRDGLLECQAHGAYFDPASGVCMRGPCPGQSLRALDLSEAGGEIFLDERTAMPVPDPD